MSIREELTGRANQWLPVMQVLGNEEKAKKKKKQHSS